MQAVGNTIEEKIAWCKRRLEIFIGAGVPDLVINHEKSRMEWLEAEKKAQLAE